MIRYAFAFALLAAPALAHEEHTMVAGFGGQITEVGDYRIEFALSAGEVRVYVSDHQAPLPLTKIAGKAALLIGGKKSEVVLSEIDGVLAAKGAFDPTQKATAILALTIDGKPVGARFATAGMTVPALTPTAQAGKAVFDKVCAQCHGPNAGGTRLGPPLIHPYYAPGHHGDDAFGNAVAKGVASHHWKFGDMPPQPDVEGKDVPGILAYVRELQAANGIVAAPAAPTAAATPDPHAAHRR